MAVNQLKIVVSVLKELSEGNNPSAEDYGIEKETFWNILKAAQDEKLVENISFRFGRGNRIIGAITDNARITIRGMEYLNDNSALMKTYKGLKEVREWLPF